MGLPLDKLRFLDKFEAKIESALGFEAGAEGKIILEEKIEAEKNRKFSLKNSHCLRDSTIEYSRVIA
jgi:hypothetical protein